MTFNRLDRQPAYLEVAAQIRDAIRDGQLTAGTVLPTERELSEAFGVSRGTLREALRVLQAQGLVTATPTAPHRTVVQQPSSGLEAVFQSLVASGTITLFDLLEYRWGIERVALERGALESDRERWLPARDALERMCSAVDVEDFHRADSDFHAALVASCGNVLLDLSMRATMKVLDEHSLDDLREFLAQDPARRDWLIGEYAAILEAAEAEQSALAQDLVRGHISEFYNQLLALGLEPQDTPKP
jgi:DNA-binding FadR family transcriptional regulator